jgi:hypothetical protein
MFTLAGSRRYNTLVSYKRTAKFRFHQTVLDGYYGSVLFLTRFNNAYKKYVLVSLPVPNGNYKVKVTSLDAKQNESLDAEGTVAITFTPLAPVNVVAEVSGSNVIFTWETSVDGNPDFYVIYGNDGTGSTSIDRSSPLATISGSLNTYTLPVANGNWSFVIESKKSGVESVTMNKVTVQVSTSATIPPKPGPSGSNVVTPTGLLLNNVSVGAVNISFLWLWGVQADTFNVYHDNGTGTIDYTSPKYTFARQNQLIQSYTTPQLIIVDGPVTYKFAVRAVLNGVDDGNKDEYTIDVDGKAPDAPIQLVLDSIF